MHLSTKEAGKKFRRRVVVGLQQDDAKGRYRKSRRPKKLRTIEVIPKKIEDNKKRRTGGSV